jgi:hypothetical protein
VIPSRRPDEDGGGDEGTGEGLASLRTAGQNGEASAAPSTTAPSDRLAKNEPSLTGNLHRFLLFESKPNDPTIDRAVRAPDDIVSRIKGLSMPVLDAQFREICEIGRVAGDER